MFLNLFITMFLWLTLLFDVRMAGKRLVSGIIEAAEEESREPFRRRRYRAVRIPTFGRGFWVFLTLIVLSMGFFHGITTMTIPLHIYAIWAVILRGGSFWVIHEMTDRKAFVRKLPRLSPTRFVLLSAVLCVALFLAFVYPALLFRTIGFTRASVMRDAIDRFEVGTMEMFPEVDPESLRVTTSTIARSVAEIKRSSAASVVTGVHLGVYKGTLSWICTVSETPLFGRFLLGESNRIREIIVVPVNDATGEKSVVVPLEIMYGEGLWFQHNIEVHASDRFPLRTFTRGYITSYGEEMVLVTTSYLNGILAYYDPKVHVWSVPTGELVGEYTPNDAPEWIVQRWDEDYLENMGDNFGDFRWNSANDLNYWNGVPYFSDRSADPSEPEGLRYQMWNGELTAVYLFDNKRNREILEFVMIATQEGLTLYSVDHLKLLSPDDAKEAAMAGLPALPGERVYRAPLALLYRIGSELYYHIPLYTLAEGHYYPVYFALIRATDRSVFRAAVGEYGGMTGAIEAAYELVGVKPTEETTITGTLEAKYEYTEGGNTRYWLTIRKQDGSLVDVLVKVETLSPEEVLKILKASIGDVVSVVVDQNNVVVKVL